MRPAGELVLGRRCGLDEERADVDADVPAQRLEEAAEQEREVVCHVSRRRARDDAQATLMPCQKAETMNVAIVDFAPGRLPGLARRMKIDDLSHAFVLTFQLASSSCPAHISGRSELSATDTARVSAISASTQRTLPANSIARMLTLREAV